MPEDSGVGEVFISYSSENLNEAKQVADALGEAGITYWMGKERISIGSSFLKEITVALDHARILVLVLSKSSTNSKWVQSEVVSAIDKRIPVLPFRIEDFELSAEFEFLLKVHQWDEVSANTHARLSDLIRAVEEKLREAEVADSSPAPAQQIRAELKGVDPEFPPYVGPQPFTPRMADWFFGRQREAREILKLVTSSRIVLIYAPSGAGKSSVLNTLVSRDLDAAQYEVLLDARVGGALPPGVPLTEIRDIFTYAAIYGLDSNTTPNPRLEFKDYLGSIAQKRRSNGRVIVFDQFEELFTLHKDRFEERALFFRGLVGALEADPRLRIVLSMRQEYLAEIEPFADALPDSLKMERYALRRLDRAGALQAVKGPAAAFAEFDTGVAEDIVAQLNTIRYQVDGETVEKRGEFIELVHLQIVCERLWRNLPDGLTKIEAKHVEDAAGEDGSFDDFVVNALDRFYEDTVNQVAAAAGFPAGLVRLGCMGFVTPEATRKMIPKESGRTGRLPNQIVEQLEACHLLRVEQRGGDQYYELSHDRLAEPVARKMDGDVVSLFYASDLLGKFLNRALDGNGGTLENYFHEHNELLEECRPFYDQAGLFEDEAEFLFRASLVTGAEMEAWSKRLAEDFPEIRLKVLREAIEFEEPGIRKHAAQLFGQEAGESEEILQALIELAMNDEDAGVRREAGISLAKLDRSEAYLKLINLLGETEKRPAALRALSRIRIVVDQNEKISAFEGPYGRMEGRDQRAIRNRAWATRFKEDYPVIFVLGLIAAVFSGVSAACFKWLPGLLNWSLTQGSASAIASVFHAFTAGVFWGGAPVLMVTFFHVVFHRRSPRKSYFRPLGAILFAAVGGFVASAIIMFIIMGVYEISSLVQMSWLPPDFDRTTDSFWRALVVERRFILLHLFSGTGMAVGAAMMTNGIRAAGGWSKFFKNQQQLTSPRQVVSLVGQISKVAIRHAWPIPLAIGAFCFVAFFVPATTPIPDPLPSILPMDPALKPTKLSVAFGLTFDGLTQCVGAFFAIVGMGLGMIALRYGINVAPRNS